MKDSIELFQQHVNKLKYHEILTLNDRLTEVIERIEFIEFIITLIVLVKAIEIIISIFKYPKKK